MNNQLSLDKLGVLGWFQQHWLIVAILVLAVLLLLFVLVPWMFKIMRRRRNAVETSELKKDLMIWRNLANLIQGGDRERSAKQTLSGQLKLIRNLFRQGGELLRESGRKSYELPWYMLVGEPMSGKSTLLKNSELELLCSAAEEMSEPGKRQSLPLRYWLGPQALVMDVAGRVFFDRWVEGSSAEWSYLIRLLARKHHKKPLNGVILVIPADALISDDEALTKQKAGLIAAELQNLSSRLGMFLPCHVVVSKMDMTLGFREYFAELDENMQHQIFGWCNPDGTGKYPPELFQKYWSATLNKLREGRVTLMLSPGVLTEKDQRESRLDVSGKLYLFPENFDGLRRNLEIYLKNIFGRENWRGNNQSLLSGVFFTSAEDSGVVLSAPFAANCGKRIDEAAISSRVPAVKQGFFIKKLLHDLIFPHRNFACFTTSELVKRRVPFFLLCLAIFGIGLIWAFAGLLKSNRLREELQPMAAYYRELARIAENKSLVASPLIDKSADGEFTLMSDAEMLGNSRFSRLQFFYDAHNKAVKDIRAPFGFNFAGLLNFGWRTNLGIAQRNYIFNQIQTEMVYLPVIAAVQERFTNPRDEAFDKAKRDALFDFSEIVFSSNPDYRSKENLSGTPVDAFLLYLFPKISMDTVNLLSSYDGNYNWSKSETAAKIIYDYRYPQAQRQAFGLFFEEWKKLNLYDDSLYPLLRRVIRNGMLFHETQLEFARLVEALPERLSESGEALARWSVLREKQRSAGEQIDSDIQRLLGNKEMSQIIRSSKVVSRDGRKDTNKEVKQILPLNVMLQAIEDYEKKIAEDQLEINAYISNCELFSVGRGSTSFFTMERHLADNAFAAARANLGREIDLLRGKCELIRRARLFSMIEDDKHKELIASENISLGYQAIDRLGELSGALRPVKELTGLAEFPAAWESQEADVLKASAEFDAYAKKVSELPGMSKLIADERKLLNRQIEYNRFVLAGNLLKFYPESTAEFSSMISKKAANENILDISPRLAKESIGVLPVRGDFDPEATLELLWPFLQIAEQSKVGKAGTAPKRLSAQLRRYPVVEKMIRDYLKDYLEYWGTYADNLRMLPPDWTAYRAFCHSVKPYQVNMLLFVVYKNSVDTLEKIPDILLGEELKKSKKAMIAALTDKMQILNPHFSEICIRQVNAWATLSKSPENAFQYLSDLPEKNLNGDYLAIIASGAKGDIPWWSNLISRGVSLLKAEAGKQFLATFQKNEFNMLCFPLCADSLNTHILGEGELGEIHSLLTTLGFSPGSTGIKAAVPFRQLDIASHLEKAEQAWGNNFLILIDALINQNKPLIWNLALPDMAKQASLSAALFPDMPSACHRFRYLEIAFNGKAAGGRVKTDSSVAGSSPLARGNVKDSDLELRFYAFSSDAVPEAVVNLPGEWSILRLYLLKGSYFDPENKLLYVPLTVTDRFGGKYLCWVSLSFNMILPLPDQWPSTQNWPDFSETQKLEKQKRRIPVQNWLKLIRDTADYDSLSDKLRLNALKDYPTVEISLSEATVSDYPILLKYRYVALVSPGQREERVAMNAGAGRVLGRVSLTEPKLELHFFRHSTDKTPAEVFVIDGPYAPLRLLTSGSRRVGKSTIEIVEPLANGELLPLSLKLMK